MATYIIQIKSERLSDNLEVFDVTVDDLYGMRLKFNAITENDAIDLAAKFRDAIEFHTNEEVEER